MGAGASRNDACPCGSGVKYKRCCLPEHETALASRRRGHEWDADPDTPRNHALGLIREGHLDGAAAIADRMKQEFPELPDAHELRAMILEARGQPQQAIVDLRKVRALIEYLDEGESYDPEFHRWLDREIERLAAVTPDAAPVEAEPR